MTFNTPGCNFGFLCTGATLPFTKRLWPPCTEIMCLVLSPDWDKPVLICSILDSQHNRQLHHNHIFKQQQSQSHWVIYAGLFSHSVSDLAEVTFTHCYAVLHVYYNQKRHQTKYSSLPSSTEFFVLHIEFPLSKAVNKWPTFVTSMRLSWSL